jgi:hypothetical protein
MAFLLALFHVEPTVHAGDLIVSGFLALASYGMRRLYSAITHFVSRVDLQAEVLDQHSEVLEVRGLTVEAFPRVTREHSTRRARRATL